jgi:hypothetical protein
LTCATFATLNFPQAFSLVGLELDMDREAALLEWGRSDFRQAASLRLDDRARSFVELEAGGAEAFTGLLRNGPFQPYQWVVRHFRAGEVREVEIRFRELAQERTTHDRPHPGHRAPEVILGAPDGTLLDGRVETVRLRQ